jgi:hypothetical protein
LEHGWDNFPNGMMILSDELHHFSEGFKPPTLPTSHDICSIFDHQKPWISKHPRVVVDIK